MAIVLLGLGAFGLLLGLAATALARWGALRVGLVDCPGGHKAHESATPLGGGMGIWAGFWIPLWAGVVASVLLAQGERPPWLPSEIFALLPGVLVRLPRLLAIFAGGCFIAALGLVDDRWSLPALPRFAAQMAVALALFLCGIRITIFIDSPLVTGAITVLWIAGLTNSFNWLDNMDGQAAGVGAIVGAMLLVVALQTGQSFLAASLAPLVGALLGFLVLNWPPAKVFMGDCGGMHLGYALAALSAEITFYQPHKPLFPVVVPLLIFAVPLFDTLSVLAIRFHEGRPLHVGDNCHFSHRLVALGMTRPQAVATVCLLTLALGLGATVLYHSTTAGTLAMLFQALALISVIVVLERAAKKEKKSPEPEAGRNPGA